MPAGEGTGDGRPAEPPPIRVLHVDDPAARGRTSDRLEGDGAPIDVTTVPDASSALSALAAEEFDCVVSEYAVPGTEGVEFLEAVRERHDDLPFVLYTERGSATVAREAIEAGVSDYVEKPEAGVRPVVPATRVENVVDRDRAEEAVETTSQWHQRIVEASNDVMVVVDPGGTIRYASPSIVGVLGYEPSAVVGTDAFDYVHPEDRPAAADAFAAVLAGADEVPLLEFRCETADGTSVPVESHARNLLDDPLIGGLVVYLRDVSDRRATRRELERYETVVEASGDGVYTLDASGHYTFMNRANAAILGYEPAELIGEPVSTVLDDEAIERSEALIRALIGSDRDHDTLELEVITKGGDRVATETHLALLPSDDGSFRGTVGFVRDITERKAREETLEWYETILEATGDHVYTLDPDGRFTYVNEALANFGGYDVEEMLGEHVSLVMDEGDVETGAALIRDLLAGDDGDHGTFEMDVLTRDGRRIPTENHIALLTGEDGAFRGTCGVVRDISERKEREEALERQNERLERFASMLSHDLRNPLNVATGRLELAADTVESAHLETAQEALDRMEAIVGDVLSLARQGQRVVDPDRTDPVAAAGAAWRTVDAPPPASMAVEEAVAPVLADGSRLQQLFENLFRNAVEHGGPDVAIRVGRLEDDEAGQIGLFVEDDGPGIPPEARERVFEFGLTTSEDGTGFGLTIVREIAEAHGWTVAAVEGNDGGARFELTGIDPAGDG